MKERISALEGQLANLIVRLEEGLDAFQEANQTKSNFSNEIASLKKNIFGELREEFEQMVSDTIRPFQKNVTSEIELLKTQCSEVERLKRQNRRLEERLTAIEEEMEKRSKTSTTLKRVIRRTL